MTEEATDADALVEVWRFRRFDERAGQLVTSIGKATLAAIERFGAEAIPGTAERVAGDTLDLNGIYRVATPHMSAPTRRRLERLKAQYKSLLDDESHERLAGWSDRVEALSAIVRDIEMRLAAFQSVRLGR